MYTLQWLNKKNSTLEHTCSKKVFILYIYIYMSKLQKITISFLLGIFHHKTFSGYWNAAKPWTVNGFRTKGILNWTGIIIIVADINEIDHMACTISIITTFPSRFCMLFNLFGVLQIIGRTAFLPCVRIWPPRVSNASATERTTVKRARCMNCCLPHCTRCSACTRDISSALGPRTRWENTGRLQTRNTKTVLLLGYMLLFGKERL